MVSILVHDHVYDRAVFELGDEKLTLILFSKFEGDVHDATTVLVLRKLDHLAVNLIDNVGPME